MTCSELTWCPCIGHCLGLLDSAHQDLYRSKTLLSRIIDITIKNVILSCDIHVY